MLFDASPAASLLFAAHGVVLRANGAAQRMFRCVAGELDAQPVTHLFPEGGWSPGRQAGVARSDIARRVSARRLDGTTFPAQVRVAALGDGDAPELLVTVEDVSEFDAALAERIAQLATANKEFESFIDAAAHDLRTPLRILCGFADALEEECGTVLNEDGRAFLKEILKASGRMEGLIDGLLALARCGRAEMQCEKVDLTTLIDLVFYELRHAATERVIDCHVEPGLHVWADVRLLMTVLRNLLGNSWKFTLRSAQPSIRVYSEQRDGRTWMCVSDNGAGFDMAHAQRLFKPFTRLHLQDEFAGHGLGLATVQRIVQRHGGEVAAEAAVNQGATVRFWLRDASD
jgi:light-regulated signal transduction histidine kinase (bacteriophytochrome)